MIYNEQTAPVEPPGFSPWGTVHGFKQPLERIPIFAVKAGGDGGYMVESTWADQNLNVLVRTGGIMFKSGDQWWVCFEQDLDWMLLLWDYPPLFDVYHELGDAVDSLESSIKWVFPAFLPLYHQQFRTIEDSI